jgi:histidine triad (HIT) family protein
MSACIFCDIVAGDAPSSVVYGDDTVLAFMDINPINPGHIVIIPKKHVPCMADLDEDTGTHLFRTTMRMVQAIRHSGVKCEGVNLLLADGEAAGQEVFHLHILVFPRYKGDSFRASADWSVKPSRQELDEVAVSIRKAYKSLF